jgi:hypothetical protein
VCKYNGDFLPSKLPEYLTPSPHPPPFLPPITISPTAVSFSPLFFHPRILRPLYPLPPFNSLIILHSFTLTLHPLLYCLILHVLFFHSLILILLSQLSSSHIYQILLSLMKWPLYLPSSLLVPFIRKSQWGNKYYFFTGRIKPRAH